MNLIKPATVLAPSRMSMHVKWFSDLIQYDRQACVKECPQPMAMQRSVDNRTGTINRNIGILIDGGVSMRLSI